MSDVKPFTIISGGANGETYDTLNYHVVKQAEMVLAFTTFQPER